MRKKTCSKCKTEKKTDEFGKNKQSPDGLSYWCRDCTKASQKASYERKKAGVAPKPAPEPIVEAVEEEAIAPAPLPSPGVVAAEQSKGWAPEERLPELAGETALDVATSALRILGHHMARVDGRFQKIALSPDAQKRLATEALELMLKMPAPERVARTGEQTELAALVAELRAQNAALRAEVERARAIQATVVATEADEHLAELGTCVEDLAVTVAELGEINATLDEAVQRLSAPRMTDEQRDRFVVAIQEARYARAQRMAS